MNTLEFLSSPPSSDPYDDLLQLNKEGFLAGPEEEKQAFFLRVERTLAEAPVHPPPFPHRITETLRCEPFFFRGSVL